MIKNKMKKIIILGASGLVGRYLFDYLKKSGKEVVGTYNKNEKAGLFYFDITDSPIETLPIKDADYVIICSGIVKIDECKKDIDNSEKVNVIAIKRVIKEFSKKDIIPVFISGAIVFDGVGDYKEEDIRNPANEYGKQKKEIEDYLMDNYKNYLIIRLGKVFGFKDKESDFATWINKYNNGEEIPCIYDEDLSLTSAEDIAKGITILLEKNKRGIFHIDSGVHKSRFEFAIDFFNFLKLKDAKIIRKSVKDFNFLEKRAKNQFLDSSKFIKETNFKFTPLENSYTMIQDSFKI